MLQISNHVFCDSMFATLEIENKILPNQYKDYPYLIIKDFLSRNLLKEIVDFVQESQNEIKAKVKTHSQFGIIENELQEEYRKTNIYFLNEIYEKMYEQQFLYHKQEIENFFNVAITNASKLQLLEYTKGCFYVKHSDDSSELIDENSNTVGFVNVAPQRKLSSVLFCSDYQQNSNDPYSFEGGELKFSYLFNAKNENICIRPNVGDLIVFPSNPIFSHEVLEVISGYRLTAVQWHDAIIF